MAKIKLTRVAIEKAAQQFDVFSKRKNNNKYFSFFIIRNIHHLLAEIQSISTLRQSMVPSERISEYDNKRIKIAERLCKKDTEGTPIYKYSNDNFGNTQPSYIFDEMEQKQFADELKQLSTEYIEDLNEYEASVNEFAVLMNEEVEVDVVKISFANIPDDIDITNIIDFIEEPKETLEESI